MDGHSLSHGICQMKLGTAQFMDTVYKHKVKVTAKRLENPYVNAFYAAKYLKYHMKRFNDWRLAIDAYNKHTPQGKNTKYVKSVMKSYKKIATYAFDQSLELDIL